MEKWPKPPQNGQNCRKMAKRWENGRYGQNGGKMAKTAKKWLTWWEIDQNGGNMTKMVEKLPKRWENGQNGQHGGKMTKMVEN